MNADMDNIQTKETQVIHPTHYNGACSIECIDAMRLMIGDYGTYYFCLGNAVKYMWRYQYKGDAKGDLLKAKNYLDMAAECDSADKSQIKEFRAVLAKYSPWA